MGQLRLQLRRSPIDLPATIDQEAGDAPLEHHGVLATDPEDGDTVVRGRPDEGRDAFLATVAFNDEGGRHPSSSQGCRHLGDVVVVRGDDRERRPGDDREIAGLECLEGWDPGPQDADPGDLALRPFRVEIDLAGGPGERKDRAEEFPERRHLPDRPRQADRRVTTRSSRSRLNSRSTST